MTGPHAHIRCRPNQRRDRAKGGRTSEGSNDAVRTGSVPKSASLPARRPDPRWRRGADTVRDRTTRLGFDYVHSLVDDHSQAGVLGSPGRREGARVRRVPRPRGGLLSSARDRPCRTLMTDNAWAYKYSLRELCAELGIAQKFINPIALGRTGKSNDSPDPSNRVGASTGVRQQR